MPGEGKISELGIDSALTETRATQTMKANQMAELKHKFQHFQIQQISAQ